MNRVYDTANMMWATLFLCTTSCPRRPSRVPVLTSETANTENHVHAYSTNGPIPYQRQRGESGLME